MLAAPKSIVLPVLRVIVFRRMVPEPVGRVIELPPELSVVEPTTSVWVPPLLLRVTPPTGSDKRVKSRSMNRSLAKVAVPDPEVLVPIVRVPLPAGLCGLIAERQVTPLSTSKVAAVEAALAAGCL